MICANCRLERPTRPHAQYLGHRVVDVCAECVISLTAIGMSLTPVERRVADVPVARDRRRFLPAWLANLTARDETGAVLR